MISFFLAYLSLVLVCCDAHLASTTRPLQSYNCSDNISKPLIVGGEKVRAGEFPWMVLLDIKYIANGEPGTHMCGGVLLKGWDVVLTAAHCLMVAKIGGVTIKPEGITVCANALDRCRLGEKDTQCVTAKRYRKHDDFNSETGFADIAVIWLSEKLNTANTANLPKISFDSSIPSNATIVGWGKTNVQSIGGGGEGSRYLLKTTVQILNESLPDCKALSDQICATGENHDACYGDSGGPLIWSKDSDSIHGIVSKSANDSCGRGPANGNKAFYKSINNIITLHPFDSRNQCSNGTPKSRTANYFWLYTSVSTYKDWVDRHMACESNRNAFLDFFHRWVPSSTFKNENVLYESSKCNTVSKFHVPQLFVICTAVLLTAVNIIRKV